MILIAGTISQHTIRPDPYEYPLRACTFSEYALVNPNILGRDWCMLFRRTEPVWNIPQDSKTQNDHFYNCNRLSIVADLWKALGGYTPLLPLDITAHSII